MKILFVYFNKNFRPRAMLGPSLHEIILKNGGHKIKIFDIPFYPQFMSDYENFIRARIYKKIGTRK